MQHDPLHLQHQIVLLWLYLSPLCLQQALTELFYVKQLLQYAIGIAHRMRILESDKLDLFGLTISRTYKTDSILPVRELDLLREEVQELYFSLRIPHDPKDHT